MTRSLLRGLRVRQLHVKANKAAAKRVVMDTAAQLLAGLKQRKKKLKIEGILVSRSSATTGGG
ncbi:MAG TPA: hypothetical protein VEA41_10445 [Salinarimonas sp.]|nr:hypothetical protein [Salinarimonas sp.]